MDSHEALELVDAHLDGEQLTSQQAEALSGWIKEDARQADTAFRRIFLHTYLRRRIQTLAIGSAPPIAGELTDGVLPQLEGTSRSYPTTKWRPFATALLGLGVVVGLVGAFLGWQSGFPEEVHSPYVYEPFRYEGFDYEGFGFPVVPNGIPEEVWPTEGGLTGLAGGEGFAGPWREHGPLVSVIESDPMSHPFGNVDLRQFSPLRYVDRHGLVLQSEGHQMRTSAGNGSNNERKLDVHNAPASWQDGEQLGADDSTIWLSFLAQSYDGAGEHRFAYLEIGSPDTGFHFGKLASEPNGNWAAAGVLNGREVNPRASEISSGESVFVVIRIEFRPGMEHATVWLNPDLGQVPTKGTAMCELQVPDFRFDSISIQGRYSTDFDELRLGTSFWDVAPVAH